VRADLSVLRASLEESGILPKAVARIEEIGTRNSNTDRLTAHYLPFRPELD
jgi:hypothetical protein